MNINLQKLEYNKILEKLSEFCDTEKGKNIALNLLPYSDSKIVKEKLSETEEAVNLGYRNLFPSFYNFSDISHSIKSLKNESTLSTTAILNLSNILKNSDELKKYFNKDFIDNSSFPILTNLFDSLYSNKNIYLTIEKSIKDDETILDDASPELAKIRQNERKLEQEIRNTLNNIIHSNNSKYLQDNIITIRNDRFVIPVKEEYRSKIKGFVHDVSNAGSTLFIEPISVFEMNNKITELKAEEEIEIEKILKKLSMLFVPYIDELQQNIEILGNLDFIFAKAKYSKSINGITPKINTEKYIDLIDAKHPLIDEKKCVPLSINLGKEFSTLLITGPNTGGKTVALKTTGLLCAMANSGLNIPANEHSSIYVFDKIFADIGDDQSILSSLSTFSSHITNIISILKKSTTNSLVLIDELGSGTDPTEGANLALSILEDLHSKNILTIVTTHYPELKNYAQVTNGFENASVEFDVKTLKPTYRLLIGIPGKSNAFEISQNLGLPKNIIDNAKSKMSKDQINIEDLLKNIYDNKSKIENEKIEIDQKLKRIHDIEKKLQIKEKQTSEQETELINNAKIQARNILLDAKDEANTIIKNLQTISNSAEANKLRNKLNKDLKSLNNNDNKTTNTKNISQKNSIGKDDIKPNLEVYVPKFKKNGTILSYPSKSDEVQIQIGSLKLNVSIYDLEKAKSNTNSSKNLKSTFSNIEKARKISSEINVIGYNVEEANFVIDKFLDDASLAHLKSVRIVHGKGTGKLKDGIHRFLRKNPHVKSFRMGTYGEGEMGVTVVELK